jgi:hypothetical protein
MLSGLGPFVSRWYFKGCRPVNVAAQRQFGVSPAFFNQLKPDTQIQQQLAK